jgi:Domain of unknown function (DUF4156)
MKESVFSLMPLGLARATAAIVFSACIGACASEFPEHVALSPAGQGVDFTTDPPSADAYVMVGKVTGISAAHDPDAAQEAARNDMRNKAAALGATLVTIDEDEGEALPLRDETKVTLAGRAYKPID